MIFVISVCDLPRIQVKFIKMQKKEKSDKKVVIMSVWQNRKFTSFGTKKFVISAYDSPRKHVKNTKNAKKNIRQLFGHHVPIWQR